MLTYYVVQAFEFGRKGQLVGLEPLQVQTADQARRLAMRFAETKPGVIAFSRTGDMDTGEFEDAKILFSHGAVPVDLESAAA